MSTRGRHASGSCVGSVTNRPPPAVKSIDTAARETSDGAARKALEDARGALAVWLATEGITVAQGATEAPVKRGRRNAVVTA